MEKVLRGYLTRFLVSKDNGWGMGIFTSEENKKAQIKIKGSITLMKPKVLYEISGVIEEHAKYGKSFSVTNFKLATSNSKDKVIKFLSSPMFPGIGERAAEKIVEHYEDDVIAKIKQNYDSLYEVKGLPNHQARIIIDALKLSEESEILMSEFFENDLKIDILHQIKKYAETDEEIYSILKNNFFSFAVKKKMRTFNDVDKVAVHFGLNLTSPERIGHWAAKIAMDICMNSGNTYLSKNQLINKLTKEIKINDSEIIMDGLIYAKEHELLFFKEGKIYPAESWNDENTIASELTKLEYRSNFEQIPNNIDELISQVENEIANETNNISFSYDEIQKQALKQFIQSDFLILTGGPGTGKTTVIKGMSKLFTKVYNSKNIGIAAPTGRATARINETWTTGLTATTIHKMLKADANDNFEINENNPLTFDLIILDESSMIENHLFAQFIKSIGMCKKIVLVGDINQLPSVGYGNMFEDLIQTNLFTTIKLQNIYRQADGNGIIDLALAIQNNTIDELDFDNLAHVKTKFGLSPEESLKQLSEDFNSNLNLINESPFNYQIISPYYAFQMGVENVNAEIQAEFNSNVLDKKKVYDRGRHRYAVGDKIMFLKNDSEMDLTNGEIGIIEKMKIENEKLDYAWVNFGDNKIKELKSANFEDVNLSYACSVHKTQGSEYKYVVLMIGNELPNNWFLNKKLIYTAITRAKEELVIIGDKQTFIRAAKRESISRNTTLKEKIIEQNNNLHNMLG